MAYNPPGPKKGTPLKKYLTEAYLKELEDKIKELDSRLKSITGGPGITVTNFGGSFTIKAARNKTSTSSGPPVTEDNHLSLGTDEGEEGKWVTDDGYVFNCLNATICIEGVETPCLILVGLIPS